MVTSPKASNSIWLTWVLVLEPTTTDQLRLGKYYKSLLTQTGAVSSMVEQCIGPWEQASWGYRLNSMRMSFWMKSKNMCLEGWWVNEVGPKYKLKDRSKWMRHGGWVCEHRYMRNRVGIKSVDCKLIALTRCWNTRKHNNIPCWEFKGAGHN